MPKIVTSAKVPAEAKLELVEPPQTIERAKGGHGVASRSLKRSSKNNPALRRSSSDAQALDGGGRRRGRERGALVRRARGGGLPVGVIVAIPIVLVFGVGLLLLTGGGTPPSASTAAPPASPAPASLPPPTAPAPIARDGERDRADAPAPARPRTAGDDADDEAAAAAHAELLRAQSREQIERERRMIEELERKAGGAPASAGAETPADAAAVDDAAGE